VVIEADTSAVRRTPLTRERVLRTAVDLADLGGLEAVSMRKLGQELGVEAMALYRHVRNKDDILDGIVEAVINEIEIPDADGDWKSTLRRLVIAARQVMFRHPWAPRLLQERTTVGPATLAYIDNVLAILRDGGLSLDLAHHTLHVMGSRILGFNQELFEDSADATPDAEAAASFAQSMALTYPRIAELAMAARHDGALGACDDDFEFEFGLDLILDGLERRRATDASPSPAG
jgi:AcrR family transcriptional regulator